MAISAADLVVKFSADTRGAEQGIQKVNRGVTSFAKGVAQVAGGFVLGNVLGAATQAFAGTVSGALDFERQMANVNSIIQVGQDELRGYSDAVLAMAGRTAQAPAVLAAGLYDVASSGFAGKEGLTVLEAAANAATAGLTTTDVAARAITAGLNAYGLGADQAQRVSDVLFQTVNEGVITFDQLANNLGNVLPIAASLGVSIEEVGAAYAQMTLSGVQASQAETQIAALMRSALNPTEALTAAVQEQGFASAAAAIEQEGLAGFLKIVTEAANGDKEALFELLGTQEAMNAATILGKNGVEDYAASLERMNLAGEDGGATQKALAKQMESSAFQIQRMKVAVQTLATIGFGILAPLVSRAAIGLASFIQRGLIPFGRVIGSAFDGGFEFNELIKDLPQPLQRAAHAVGVIAEGIGDLIRDGFSANELRQIVSGLDALGEELLQGAQWVANIAIDLVTNFAGWLWDNRGAIWDGIKALIGWSVDAVTELVSLTIDGAISLAGDLADAAGNLWGWITAKLGGTTSISEAGSAVGLPIVQARPIDIGSVLITAALKIAEVDFSTVATAVGDGIVAAVQGLVGLDVDIAQAIVNKVTAVDWSQYVTPAALFGFGQSLGDALATAVQEIPARDWAIFAAKVGLAIFGALTLIALSPVLIAAGLGIVMAGAVKGFVDTITPDSWNAGDLANKVIGGIAAALADATEILSVIADGIVNAITDAADLVTADSLVSLGSAIAGAIKKAIIAGIKELPGFAQDVWNTITSVIQSGGPRADDRNAIVSEFLPVFGTGRPLEEQPQIPQFLMGRGLGGGFAGLAGAVARAKQREPALTQTVTITADVEPAASAIANISTALRGLVAMDWRPTLGLNPAPFASALASSLRAGTAFAAMTFTPTLAADSRPYASAVASSLRAGRGFGAQTFTATLAADTGPLRNAVVGAYLLGAGWASTVFTATFAVNTTPLLAAVVVARRVAQEISDLLPGSPAKTGPLARPISFAYIAEAARRDLAGVGDLVSQALGGVGSRSRALAGGRGAGPRTVQITISGVPDPEAVWRVLDRELTARGL